LEGDIQTGQLGPRDATGGGHQGVNDDRLGLAGAHLEVDGAVGQPLAGGVGGEVEPDLVHGVAEGGVGGGGVGGGGRLVLVVTAGHHLGAGQLVHVGAEGGVGGKAAHLEDHPGLAPGYLVGGGHAL